MGLNLNEAAAAWVVRMHSDQCTREDELAFDRWLREDSVHGEAYRRHLALWQGVAGLSESDAARDVLHHRPLSQIPLPWRRGPFLRAIAVAAAAAAIAGIALLRPEFPFGLAAYSTAHGEQRTIMLEDGSRVTLNTDSRLRVRLQTSERRLVLEQGQAFFQVAKDAARPFRVFVGRDEVRAVGTAFDVRKEGSVARVTLEEGIVALYRGTDGLLPQDVPASTAGAMKPAAILNAGQQAKLAALEPIAVTDVDLRPMEAWREGLIVLENMTLSDAVAEVNRYAGQKIVVNEVEARQLRISGVFHTGHPEVFVQAVVRALPIHVVQETNNRIELGSSHGNSSK